ncbi:unnamed protein product [Ixodes pacificus]
MLHVRFASAKIERLRKEGSTQLEEQRELLRKQVAEELRLTPASAPSLHNPERDYESLVLMKLRQAEERKRLSEQLAAEDT